MKRKSTDYTIKSIEDQNHYKQVNTNHLKMHATSTSNMKGKSTDYSIKLIEDQNHYQEANTNYPAMHATSSSQRKLPAYRMY